MQVDPLIFIDHEPTWTGPVRVMLPYLARIHSVFPHFCWRIISRLDVSQPKTGLESVTSNPSPKNHPKYRWNQSGLEVFNFKWKFPLIIFAHLLATIRSIRCGCFASTYGPLDLRVQIYQIYWSRISQYNSNAFTPTNEKHSSKTIGPFFLSIVS